MKFLQVCLEISGCDRLLIIFPKFSNFSVLSTKYEFQKVIIWQMFAYGCEIVCSVLWHDSEVVVLLFCVNNSSSSSFVDVFLQIN